MHTFSMKNTFSLCCLIAASVTAFMFSSCGTTRPYTYMQGSFDTAKLSQINIPEPVIRKGDILSIIVYSDNPALTSIYNQPMGGGGESSSAAAVPATASSSGGESGAASGGSGTATSAASPSSGGYLVDENGNIEFQGQGTLHVEGLTRAQLKELLESKLKDYLKNPYCTIRFINYHITVLGEVGKTGMINIPGDHLNLLEAIALAGDMTFYARRDNVLVIRSNNNKREFARLDVTKPEIMASPYFHLQQNDMIIVEANRKKSVANDQSTIRAITITTSLVSVFAIIYTIFKK